MVMATLCMNPGPIEFDEQVLEAIGHKGISHVDKEFLEVFGSTLEMMRKVFLADDGQPLVVAGSGTLGWDLVAGNLVSPGDEILMVNTGYFSDHFGDCLERYGAKITYLNSPKIGSQPSMKNFSDSLDAGKTFKAVIVTHVDTSTGVAINLKEIASCLRAKQPQTLLIVDGVCALGGEECRMKEWDLDIVLTASQKCIGVPVGLSLLMIRPRVLEFYNNKNDSGFCSYYCDWKNWLPIMRNYEARSPSYFATPPVSHIYALNKSLSLLLQNGGMEKRFHEHRQSAQALRSALAALGCELLTEEGCYASTLTCVRYPKNVIGAEFLPRIAQLGVSVSGGLHKDVKTEYFRVGHMGLSTRDTSHIVLTVKALEQALIDCGHPVEKGKAIKTIAKLRIGFSVRQLSCTCIKTLTLSKGNLVKFSLLAAALVSGYFAGRRNITLKSLKIN